MFIHSDTTGSKDNQEGIFCIRAHVFRFENLFSEYESYKQYSMEMYRKFMEIDFVIYGKLENQYAFRDLIDLYKPIFVMDHDDALKLKIICPNLTYKGIKFYTGDAFKLNFERD